MKNYIITISREFGCNSCEIGRALASKLGVHFYDKELVDLVAEKIGVNVNVIRESDEVLNKQNRVFSEFGYGSSTNFYSEKAIGAQASVIREIANKNETCILYGRCADYFLKEYPNVINLFLYAPLEKRIEHVSKTYNVKEKEAEKMIKRIDKQRHNYYKYVTGKNRGDRLDKHVMFDVSTFGVEASVELINEAIRIWSSVEKKSI